MPIDREESSAWATSEKHTVSKSRKNTGRSPTHVHAENAE